MRKVYIRGVKGRGAEVIAKLEALRGNNTYNLYGDDVESLYYINHHKDIVRINEDESTAVTALMWAGTEIFIDEPVEEQKPVNTLEMYDPVMVSDDGKEWYIALYKKGFSVYFEMNDYGSYHVKYKFIVPLADFDFNDLKSNIKRSVV